MAGELFYSQVDQELITELNWRKDVGIRKDNEYLDWQVSRTSWASVTVMPPRDSSVKLSEGMRSINVRGRVGDPIGSQYNINNILESNSYRPGPVLENVSIQFADNSSIIPGLLNNAQLSIMVPDIDYFNREFEPYWLRAGLDIEIEFGHSVRTEQKTNKGSFKGKITNFSFQINIDATVSVTIQAKATTEVFTEIPLVNISRQIEASASNQPIPAGGIQDIPNTFSRLFDSYLPSEQVAKQPNESAATLIDYNEFTFRPDNTGQSPEPTTNEEAAKQQGFVIEGYVDHVNTTLIETDQITVNLEEQVTKALKPEVFSYIANIRTADAQKHYVSLGLVINILNEALRVSWSDFEDKEGEQYHISIASQVSKCGFNDGLISTMPEHVLFPGNDQYSDETKNSKFVAYQQWGKNWLNIKDNETIPDVRFYGENKFGRPSAILLSTELLKRIFDSAISDYNDMSSKDQKSAKITLTQFIARITGEIKLASGNLIDLQLTTHPNIASLNKEEADAARNVLILRDANYSGNTVQPFRVPLFANKINSDGKYAKAGTLIRNFNIDATIPDSLKTIGILYTQAPKSRSQYYSRYQYLSAAEREVWAAETAEKHKTAKEQLDVARIKYYEQPSESNRKDFAEALEVYNATPNLQDDTFPPPVFPLKVKFDMTGVFGFRFGDVLRFDSLPSVYQKEVVFIITAIDHTITNDWVTSITCTMRPAIGEV